MSFEFNEQKQIENMEQAFKEVVKVLIDLFKVRICSSSAMECQFRVIMNSYVFKMVFEDLEYHKHRCINDMKIVIRGFIFNHKNRIIEQVKKTLESKKLLIITRKGLGKYKYNAKLASDVFCGVLNMIWNFELYGWEKVKL